MGTTQLGGFGVLRQSPFKEVKLQAERHVFLKVFPPKNPQLSSKKKYIQAGIDKWINTGLTQLGGFVVLAVGFFKKVVKLQVVRHVLMIK